MEGFDDNEDYVQGLQALQDEIMMEQEDERFSADVSGLEVDQESIVNMASEFSKWEMEQAEASCDLGQERDLSVKAEPGLNGLSGTDGAAIEDAVDDEKHPGAVSEAPREVSKRKLEDEPEDASEDSGGKNAESDTEGPGPAKKASPEVNIRKLLPELEKLWKPVEENPIDFTSWTYLLQYVDHENELMAAREAYDGFLARYPYCYGYWKKYADLEKRKGSAEDCLKVFKRGLEAIPLSVDLWIHYLNYIKTTHESDGEYVHHKFQEALKTVGLEFRSDKLWDHYIQYERETGDLRKLTSVYDQLLAVPTQSYIQHFQNFKDFVNDNNPAEILSEEEYLDLKAIVEDVVSSASEEERDSVEKNAIREKCIEKRQEIHKSTETEAQARWTFEEAIKRPYFHVKPLEKGQLKIWKEYLDFEIERGDEKRILILFERCLIACCLYEEYWIKYVKYLQSQKVPNVQRIRDVFTRACTIHHHGKPWINLHWAAFEESQGSVDKAVDILEKLRKLVPTSAHVYFRLINLHRRQNNLPRCIELFEEYLEDRKGSSEVVHIKIKFSRFLAKVCNDFDRAIKLLNDAFDEHESSRVRVAMALVDLGVEKVPLDYQLVVSSFDRILQCEISLEERETITHRKMEFLDDFGSEVLSLQKAYEDFQSASSKVHEKKTESSRSEQDPVSTKYPKTPIGTYQTPPPQYNNSVGPSGHAASTSGQDYSNQYSQYPGWNYPGQSGYAYPPQQQNWNAYSGYQA